MKKIMILILGVFFTCLKIYAQDIPIHEIEKVANKFFKSTKNKSLPKLNKIEPYLHQDTTLFYIANDGKDFIILANDLRVSPILGYSDKGTYEEGNMPPQLKDILF